MSAPVVAIVSNALTPYRLHYHRRLVREVPGIRWASLFTHDVSNAPWGMVAEAEINPVRFGPGESSDDQSKPTRALHEFRKGGRVIRWLKAHEVAAVVLLGYNDPGRIRILSWCRSRSIPCFIFGDSNIRGDGDHGMKSLVKRRVLSSVLRKSSGVLACGSMGREYFRRYGVPDSRIHYTPYEPDYAMIASITDVEIESALTKRGLPTGRRFLMYCGRLVPVKRVDLVIDAFAACARDRPEWDLLIIGDGPLRPELESRVPELLRPRVHWTGFSGDQREVAALQRSAAALALLSEVEPWGVVINEAVAAGLAVIASDTVGAAAELVRDGVNGRVIPAKNVAAANEAVRDVTDPENLARYRAASAGVLDCWRKAADPVAGMLAALAGVGITPSAQIVSIPSN
ncbi:MAG: glycosyltransferase family 4 protein [Gemmataceae bacterium]|nr:glycosyltransferase family 4 protein [Gemmataceae bacterium]